MKVKNVVLALIIIAIALAVLLAARILMTGPGDKIPSSGKKGIEAVSAETEGALLAIADRTQNSGDLLKAREAYQRFIEKFPSSDKLPKTQEALENLNVRILFSPITTSDSIVYRIEKGDSLTRIARKFNTTPELIQRANNLKDSFIKIGKSLKISKTKFSIVIDKSQNILTLKSDQEILKTYRVSTGKNSCTPVGAFTITSRIIDPPWYPPSGGMIPSGDPKNVLGSRWLGLSKPSYGIHGTTQPESIGQSVTEGCIRMTNSDVEELYSIIPVGTEVVIVD
ncbi:MAG: L,D-transpeptidase family protein [Candidatus Omnitrophica bacterium]|nr:L,D-transpeptidase family protein [Candidatus Omnitrophota bacterium]